MKAIKMFGIRAAPTVDTHPIVSEHAVPDRCMILNGNHIKKLPLPLLRGIGCVSYWIVECNNISTV